jgi:Rrf2 family nitric oxide-sensitive transcriptional repressor
VQSECTFNFAHTRLSFLRLTLFTDYAMRVLMHLAADPDRQSSVGEIARDFAISRNHLTKVVHGLARAGYIASARGRGGGIRLARPAEEIVVGEVVRRTEDGFQLFDCGACLIAPACGLTPVVSEALAAFLGVLDRYTLADLVVRNDAMRALFAAPPQPAAA